MAELDNEIRETRQRLARLLDARVIPAVQLSRAAGLAASFGHTWGVALKASPEWNSFRPQGWTLGDIRAIARAYDENGIQAPFITDSGRISHETASRRLYWEITPDGDAYVTVQRPDGFSSIRISATADGISVRCLGQLESRHFDAAQQALEGIAAFPEFAASIIAEEREKYVSRLVCEATDAIRARVMPAPATDNEVIESLAEPDSTL